MIDIGFLHVAAERAAANPPGASAPKPLFVLDKCYGDLNIYGGIFLYEGMFKVTGGTSQLFLTIRIHDAKFAKGHNPANLFKGTGSSGYVQLEYVSCCETDNFSTGAINAGRFFPDFEGLLDPFLSSPILSGGYGYQRGSVKLVDSSMSPYQLTNFDETIQGSAFSGLLVVRLPSAASNPGKVFHVFKFDSFESTVRLERTGSDSLDGGTLINLTAQWDSVSVISYGGGWKIISKFP